MQNVLLLKEMVGFDVKGEIIITIVGILKKNKIGGSPCCSVKN